jgi:serine phosphatase RsbU (regulator of sigma subunit)
MSLLKRHSLLSRNRNLVRNTWRYFSGLGSDYSNRISVMRSYVITNQLNFVLFGTMFFLLIITSIINRINKAEINLGIIRVAALLVMSFLNLVFAHYRYLRFSKYSLIFLTPVIFIVGPALLGFAEEEGYTYNGYVLIAGSIIPQLILSHENEKVLYWISMLYYFLILVIFVDIIMVYFPAREFPIIDRIRIFFPFYLVAHIGVFLFVNISIWHLRITSFRFEDRLHEKNHVFDLQTRELREQREKIVQQKNLIEEKNRSITDSIQYASRIQRAVLQPIGFIDEWGLENFIFYKPKAVVSGDFYWGYRKQDKIIMAAADCTGHGVPGALMCMLGLAFLDDIMIAGNFRDASDLLNILREDIMHKLKQKGNAGEMREGMDISLCIIDTKAGIVDFAGANNPVYLVRDNALRKIEADKMPIGIYSSSIDPFTNKVIEIKKGDLLYLFTDGFADQFGGPNRRKFLYKPFQELILRIHMEPLAVQKAMLEETFETWKGASDQIDDVLVMGLKV